MQPGSGINLFGFALIRITSPTSTPQTRLQKRGNNKAPRCLGTSPVPNSTSTLKPTDDHAVLSRKPESNKEYKKRETKMKNARRCADSSMSCGDAAPYESLILLFLLLPQKQRQGIQFPPPPPPTQEELKASYSSFYPPSSSDPSPSGSSPPPRLHPAQHPQTSSTSKYPLPLPPQHFPASSSPPPASS